MRFAVVATSSSVAMRTSSSCAAERTVGDRCAVQRTKPESTPGASSTKSIGDGSRLNMFPYSPPKSSSDSVPEPSVSDAVKRDPVGVEPPSPPPPRAASFPRSSFFLSPSSSPSSSSSSSSEPAMLLVV